MTDPHDAARALALAEALERLRDDLIDRIHEQVFPLEEDGCIRLHGVEEAVDAALVAAQQPAEREWVGVQAREDVMSGELCFAGQNARIPVRCVLSFTRAGYTPKAIQREYPTLSILEITAAAALAAAGSGREDT